MGSRATGVEKIAASLRAEILNGAHEAGSPLRESELSSRFGVSRHVVREVLRSLASEGMVEYSAFRGARVPRLAAEDVLDIYDAREFLECGILAKAGNNIQVQELANIHQKFAVAVGDEDWQAAFQHDVEFHSSIVGAMGSDRMVKWHLELMQSLRLAHRVAPDYQSLGLERSVGQHAEVIVALAAGNLVSAISALQAHLYDARCRLLLRGGYQSETRVEGTLDRVA